MEFELGPSSIAVFEVNKTTALTSQPPRLDFYLSYDDSKYEQFQFNSSTEVNMIEINIAYLDVLACSESPTTENQSVGSSSFCWRCPSRKSKLSLSLSSSELNKNKTGLQLCSTKTRLIVECLLFKLCSERCPKTSTKTFPKLDKYVWFLGPDEVLGWKY